jgi:DNA ligase (NAD+)
MKVTCDGKEVELRRNSIPEPTECPFCGGEVGRNQTLSGEGAITMCLNPQCPAKSDLKIRSWVKKTEILGIGDSVRHALREQLGVNTPADLYKLGTEIPVETMREIIVSEGSKLGNNADHIVDEINKKRQLPLHIFLGSLGIQSLGRREVAIAMEKAPGELDTLDDWRSGKLRDAGLRDRLNAQNKGLTWADGIDGMSDIIDALLANGVSIDTAIPEPEPSGNMTICITGKLPSGKKKGDYREPLAQMGYTLVDKVSKDLGKLVVADPSNQTSKLVKAQKYGVEIITEDELVRICNG